jgi:hypothetical protein
LRGEPVKPASIMSAYWTSWVSVEGGCMVFIVVVVGFEGGWEPMDVGITLGLEDDGRFAVLVVERWLRQSSGVLL